MTPQLDPNEFEVTHVAVVDEFKMTDDDGSLVAQLDERFLGRLVARMNERERATGDLAPIVIGHTNDGLGEVDQPQIVGYARSWSVAPFFDTGRKAAFCEAWVYKTNKVVIDGKEVILTASEVAKRWPRRSAEVWTSRHEIDPISLLGATTPARDLGLMKFSRSGSITYYSPGDPPVPTPNAQSPAMDAAVNAQSAPNETQTNLLQQILAAIEGLKSALAPTPAPDAGAQGATPAAPGAPADAGQPDELSDEELAQLLGGSGDQGNPADQDDESRKGEKPVQNSGMGYPGGANTHVTDPQVRLSAVESELAATKNELARLQLQRTLADIRTSGIDVDPADDALVSDLAALPPDIRDRQIERIKKLSRKAPVNDSFHLESAVAKSTDGSMKRITTAAQQTEVIKLARDKKIQFEAAASELGYSL